jgi:hypothetical protein
MRRTPSRWALPTICSGDHCSSVSSFDHFLSDTFRKLALETVTFLLFVDIFLSQTSGITPLVTVTLKFPTDNGFVFSNKFGYLFLFFFCPE